MNNAVIEFLFKYHRGVIAPMPAGKDIPCVEEKYVYSANLKLSQDGFTMSKELIDACLKASGPYYAHGLFEGCSGSQ